MPEWWEKPQKAKHRRRAPHPELELGPHLWLPPPLGTNGEASDSPRFSHCSGAEFEV